MSTRSGNKKIHSSRKPGRRSRTESVDVKGVIDAYTAGDESREIMAALEAMRITQVIQESKTKHMLGRLAFFVEY